MEIERFPDELNRIRELQQIDIDFSPLDAYSAEKADQFNPGSTQLLRTLVAKGNDVNQVQEKIESLERICEGEPLIGMELYPDAHGTNVGTAVGAHILNGLRGKESYGIQNSQHDGKKWNYRIMPTYHPIFAVLFRELSDYMPQRVPIVGEDQNKPIPYMLNIGTDMGKDSAIVMSA